ncbi:hypothetical protein BpHYR1_025377 [Brachionus plicatilis]|uniref:Uncharacterized protein n=1 Tax=Brachionus plicatilis TaxID=10195 RepID=A0A3M7PLP0_BRAPC|nr:hypothetical protein BpHYR1_025377 [Brachionus plicatilis]
MFGLSYKILFFLPIFCLAFAKNSTFSLKTTKCQFISAKNELFCDSYKGNKTCEAIIDSLPLNFTLFAIGEFKATAGQIPLTWFRLFPRKIDNTGWWYYKHMREENKKMSLHSKDKVSKYNTGIVVVDSLCWNQMAQVIKSSSTFDVIQTERYNYGIFAKPFYRVKMIGTLEIL